MNRFWQTFLGIERSPGTIVGDTRLELTALPRGAGALAPIVAAIVRAHGGDVGLESGPGDTRITVRLPA